VNLFLIFFLFIPLFSLAERFPLPLYGEDVIGEFATTRARGDETLLDIAREFSLGYEQITKVNPKVNRWVPGDGTKVLLPKLYILPSKGREGLVLNLSELRLYYFPKDEPYVYTYPVSVGRMDWKTPLGETKVVRKDRDPPWYPPASIKAEHAADGDPLPDMIPGGIPENPLGRFALRLGIPGYLIHGTDERKSFGIGMRVTHGCVRMYPEDVAEVFSLVPVGTKTFLIDEPIKVGWSKGELFLEAHLPFEDDTAIDSSLAQLGELKQRAFSLIAFRLNPSQNSQYGFSKENGYYREPDPRLVSQIVRDGKGIPVPLRVNSERER
jgi:L,D-transpeptidase ErfK/SrfK